MAATRTFEECALLRQRSRRGRPTELQTIGISNAICVENEMVKSEPVRKAGILKASSGDATQKHHLADVAARSRARPSIVNDDSTVQIPRKRRVSFSLSPGRIPEREKGTHVMRKQRSQETPEVTKRIPGGAEKKPQDKLTASVISKQYPHALQPVKGGAFAQPRERSASCDAKGLGCGGSTVRSEIDLASKSAEFFRSEKKWSRAGTAFMRLAVLYLKIGSKQEAANKYIDGSVCFDNVDVKTSAECSGKAVEIQMELDEGALLCQQSTKQNLSVSERVGNVKNPTQFSGKPSGTDNKEEMPVTVIAKGAIASGTDTNVTSRGHISRRFPKALPHPKRFELPPCDRTFLDVVYQVSALEPVSDGRFALLFYTYQNYSMMTKSQLSELVKWVITSGAPISLLVQLVRPCGYAVRGYPARSVTDYVVLWIAGAFYYGSRGVAIKVAVRLEAYGVAKRMASQYRFRFRSYADALDAVQLWVWSDYHALLKLRRSSSKGRLNRLPCVNRYRGCSFIGSVEAGIQHGDVCPFRIFRHYPACGGCGARLRPDVSPEHVDTLSHLSVCEERVALFTADGGNSKYYKRVPVPTASLLRFL